MMRIDSHHHLWRYTPAEYGWIDDSMAPLRRDFLPDDLLPLLDEAGVDGTVAVQARQTLEETEWLLRLAQNSRILGVVGWAPLASPDFPAVLDRLRTEPALKGLRHVVQGEPDGFLQGAEFLRGVGLLGDAGLVYDVLVYARQLPQVVEFVDRFPTQQFVLDHLGKPDIRHGKHAEWAGNLRELARRPQVSCKLSGLVTEADFYSWKPAQLMPYLETALEAFGADRLMIGTDWPVCTVACGYAQWWRVVEDWIAPLSKGEQNALLGENATRIYDL